MSHSDACRTRMEEILKQTAAGRKRLAVTTARVERWNARNAQDDGDGADAHAEGESVPFRGMPPPPEARIARDAAADDARGGNEPFNEPFNATEHGHKAPVTPTLSPDMSPTPPMDAPPAMSEAQMPSPRRLDFDGEDAAMGYIMNFTAAIPEVQNDVKCWRRDILQITLSLGASVGQYKKECSDEVMAMLKPIISEIYSAPRVTAAAKMMPSLGLLPGFALDLTTKNELGERWDFSKSEHRQKARRLVEVEKPMFLIGSPACTAYSSWQQLNNTKRDPSVVTRERACADVHLAFVCELYELQQQNRRYFLHEHPDGAASWGLECVQTVMALDGVRRVVGDQCQYGQQSADGVAIKKPTGWMSNSEELLKALSRRCGHRELGRCSRPKGGQHQICSGSRVTRAAAVYPMKLCKAILVGCRNQLRHDGRLTLGIVGIQHDPFDDMSDLQLERRAERLLAFAIHDSTEQAEKEKVFRDDLTGQVLVPALVHAARRKELEYFCSKQVWEKRPRAESLAKMGKPPITVRWIDVNKGDDVVPNYRSRLVAREIRRHGEDPIFAPTPPLESLRTVLSFAATDVEGLPKHVRDPSSEERTQVSFVDISRAYFCAATDPEGPNLRRTAA